MADKATVKVLPEDWKTRPRDEQIRLFMDVYRVDRDIARDMLNVSLYGSADLFPSPPHE